MWMTREEIAAALGIVPNSVRGKVQKGQIERKIEDGKNFYRIMTAKPHVPRKAAQEESPPVMEAVVEQPPRSEPTPKAEAEAAPTPTPTPTPEEKPVHQVAFSKPVDTYIPSSPKPVEEITAPERRPAPVPPQIFNEVKAPAPERARAFNPKQVLLETLASLKIGRNIDAIEKGDEIDLATGEISRELDARISMRQHKQLKEIEDALERIKLGEYGTCEDCGEPIPEQRLRLFPAARLCVRCQEEYDQYEKMKEEQALRGGVWRDDTSESGFARAFED